MSAAPGRVFLVDDDRVFLFAASGLLRGAGHTVETFESAAALLARLSASDAGCVLVDLRMPDMDGLALQRALAERGIPMPLIFVSGRADVPSAVVAMKRGALDFLSKPCEAEELLATVARALHKDEEGAAQRLLRERARARWTELSQRQQDVCRLVATGLINKQIAAELNIAESTVQAQRAQALKRLGLQSITELALLITQAEGG